MKFYNFDQIPFEKNTFLWQPWEDGRIDMADREIGGGTTEQMVQETMKTEIFHVANMQNLLNKLGKGECL